MKSTICGILARWMRKELFRRVIQAPGIHHYVTSPSLWDDLRLHVCSFRWLIFLSYVSCFSSSDSWRDAGKQPEPRFSISKYIDGIRSQIYVRTPIASLFNNSSKSGDTKLYSVRVPPISIIETYITRIWKDQKKLYMVPTGRPDILHVQNRQHELHIFASFHHSSLIEVSKQPSRNIRTVNSLFSIKLQRPWSWWEWT